MWIRHEYFRERAPRYWQAIVGWYVVRVSEPAQAVAAIRTIDGEFANSASETRTQTEQQFAASFMKQMGNIEFLIMAVGTIVFFTLLLVTGNTMAIAVRERTGELAVLKAIGFSDRFALALVLAESLSSRSWAARWGSRSRASWRSATSPAASSPPTSRAAPSRRGRRWRSRPVPSPACCRRSEPCGCRWRRRCGGSDDGDPRRLQPAVGEGALDVVRRRGARHRGDGGRVRGHAGAGARLQGDARLVGPARERDRTARGSGHGDDERRHARGDPGRRGGAPDRARRRGAARQPGGGRDRRGADEGHARRRGERADPRRLAPGAGRARPGPDRRGPVPDAGPGRGGRRPRGAERLPGPRPGRHGAPGRRQLDGRGRLRRGRQRVRLRGVGGRDDPERLLPAAAERVPGGDGQAALARPVRRLRGASEERPARAAAGGAGEGVLREAVEGGDDAHHGARLAGGGGDGARRRVRGAQHHVLGGLGAGPGDRRAARDRIRRRSRRPLVLRRVAADRRPRRPRRVPGRASDQRPDHGHHQLADVLAPGVRVPRSRPTCWRSAWCSRC